VLTADNAGSELLIFVPRATHGHDIEQPPVNAESSTGLT
jgi:hypothetical protein